MNNRYKDKPKEQSDYIRGYKDCERKYTTILKDKKVSTADLSEEFTSKVNDWFINYCPHWGIVLKNNLWHFHLAKYFYDLGKSEAYNAIREIREEALRQREHFEDIKADFKIIIHNKEKK